MYLKPTCLHSLELLLQSLRYLLMAVREFVLSLLVKSKRLSRDEWLVDAMSLPTFDLVHHLKFDVSRRHVVANSDAFNALDMLTCPFHADHALEAACFLDRLSLSHE